MKILQSTYRLVLLIVLCAIFHVKTFAQHGKSMEIFSAEDTVALSESLKTDPQDAQLSAQDKQDVQDSLKKGAYLIHRFKDMIALKKDILWADELYGNIKAFEDSTFINIYPMAEIKGKGVMLGLINRLGEIIDGVPLEPFVRVIWSINPVTENKLPFKLSVRIERSSAIPQEVIEDALKKIESGYKNKVYNEVTETEDDIIWAMDILLLELGKKVGISLAPKYLMKVGGKSYVSGKSIQLLAIPPTAPDSLLTLQLINRIDSTDVESDVVWEGAMPGSYGEAYVNLNYIADYKVKASVGTDAVTINVNVWDDDIRRQLEGLLLSSLDMVITEMKKNFDEKIKEKQDSLNSEYQLKKSEREKIINNFIAYAGETESSATTALLISDQEQDVALASEPDWEKSALYKQYIRKTKELAFLKATIDFLYANRFALLELTKPGNMDKLKIALQNDIGKMSANAIVIMISGDKQLLNVYLTNFISAKLLEATR
jgi:hypothetical protein